MTGSWLPLFFLNPVLNWVIPFHVLMARETETQLHHWLRV